MSCNEIRELVSHGRCARCLQKTIRAAQKEREAESPFIGPDRSQSREQRELNKSRDLFARMVFLLDEAVTSALILADQEYELVKDILIAGIDRINGMQKQVNDLNSGLELTSTSGPEEITSTPPAELTAKTDPALLTPEEPVTARAFKFKIHPMSRSGDARRETDGE